MLDVSLERVSFSRGSFSLRDIDLEFERHTHTVLIGPAGCGASTLLNLIAGTIKPDSGTIRIGARAINDVKPSRRPLLHATSSLHDIPGRWSVQHALVAAVRQRSLDRVDRQREYDLALTRWRLGPHAERRIDSLSSSEQTLVQLARIELLRPAIVLADRLLERLNPSSLLWASDEIYRVFRIMGSTVINAPSTHAELGFADRVAVLSDGVIVQRGKPAEVFARPESEAAGMATGELNVIPVVVRGDEVESVIGHWKVPEPLFQGSGAALARPEDFEIAAKGEDSDVIFSVEEASLVRGRWLATGLMTGGNRLRVSLPLSFPVSKGKLLALRYDPSRFAIIRMENPAPSRFPPADAVPSMEETR